MILKGARIVNFRSLRDVEVSFGRQTAILGGNGAGKSTILKAIEKFYSPSASVTPDDFFGKNISAPIEIGLTFTDFTESENETFGSRIVDGEMNVVRVFDLNSPKSSGRYYGFIKGNPAFEAIRNADSATSKRTAYSELRKSDSQLYGDLPTVSKADEIEPHLSSWEASHSDACQLIRDDGQFLGFTNVARGSLSKSTSFVFIPAVRDASADAIDKGSSPIARLMELVVKSAVQRRKDFQEWRERTATEYKALVNPENLQELRNLAGQLTESLRVFYDNTAVNLEWQPASEFQVPLPNAMVSLEDGGYQASVERQGNGLQRAFILTLLQQLAKATVQSQNAQESEAASGVIEYADGSGTIDSLTGVPDQAPLIPGLILAIEEPELYQHPTKQRHFAHVLGRLSDGSLPGVATTTQIIFASHSPYFVSTDNFDQIRLARRCPVANSAYQECRLREATLKDVRVRLEAAYQVGSGTYTDEGLRSRLHIITPEVAEGFFADLVVLVEGESDRAAIRAAASVRGIQMESLGIAVLPAGGKFNIDRPAAIFQSLEIPVYAVWDCDRKGDQIDGENTNRALQRLFAVDESNVVSSGTRVENAFACFDSTLEKTLDEEVGQASRLAALEECKEHFSIVRNDDAVKAPAAMSYVLGKLAEQGKKSATLEGILESVCRLRAAMADTTVPAHPSSDEAPETGSEPVPV